MKEFFKSPKMTAILGIIGSILMIPSLICTTSSFFDFLPYIYVLGFIIYFVTVLLRMFMQKGNIKIANYILIISVIVPIIICILNIRYAMNMTGIIYLITYIVMALYFCNILLRKPKLINNKVFAIILALYSAYQLFILYSISKTYMSYRFSVEFELISEVIKYIGYLLIIPYFYNYYNILKGENRSGK